MGVSSRVGRPRRDTVEGRRRQVLQAAQEVIIEHGFERATMLQIADRCGASKETLYSWFGSKEGLFAELVIAAGEQTVTRLTPVLRGTDDRALRSFARSLLGLLVGPWSVAVNRAAMSSDSLARLVLTHGRHRIGPIVEAYLADLDRAGVLHVPDPASAFTELYGLVVRDTQIRVLLGEPAPSAAAQRRQADAGVDRFWQAYRATS
jgi:AcrR family transcriptional regulator